MNFIFEKKIDYTHHIKVTTNLQEIILRTTHRRNIGIIKTTPTNECGIDTIIPTFLAFSPWQFRRERRYHIMKCYSNQRGVVREDASVKIILDS